jgi:hypothetical protein
MKSKLLRGLMKTFRAFIGGNEGLVTVEWVAVAAAVVAGAVTVAWLVMANIKTDSGSVGSQINGVATTAPTPPAS